MPESEHYTVEDVARILGVTARTVINLIHRGRFPGAYKIDPHSTRSPYRIPKVDVDDYQALQRQPLSKSAN